MAMTDVLQAAFALSGLTLSELWLGYFGLGGNSTELQLSRYVSGADRPGDHEHDLIAQALNERFWDLDLDNPVPYASEGGNQPAAE
jgi:hypothetical protein